MQKIASIELQRLITPTLTITRKSQDPLVDSSNDFEELLVEEHTRYGGPYLQFIEECNRRVINAEQELFD